MERWERLGSHREICGRRLFVVDVAAEREAGPPVFILHGFPTCSMDWSEVLPALARTRRVVAFDLLGFGRSEKPDQAYSLFEQADLAEGVAGALGLAQVALATHDVGDSIGGELLARSLEGRLGFEVAQRILTNGSIYMDLVELSPGQLGLLALPDARLPEDRAPSREVLAASLAGLMGERHRAGAAAHLAALVEQMVHDEGHRLLPRLIRYIGERRQHEARWTGAIERHPSPLSIVWGADDPIARVAMAHRLAAARPDAGLCLLEGVGHFPMIEDPERFAAALLAGLRSPGAPGSR
jgi:pimeloyl-ACP methyl ester carboxylesterase